MTIDELKAAIKTVHEEWYSGEFAGDAKAAQRFHSALSTLFNFAGIENTLCKNNPDKVSPEEFFTELL